jgi:hypothetical protein
MSEPPIQFDGLQPQAVPRHTVYYLKPKPRGYSLAATVGIIAGVAIVAMLMLLVVLQTAPQPDPFPEPVTVAADAEPPKGIDTLAGKLFLVVCCMIGFAAYMLPTIIAVTRGVRTAQMLAVLNIAMGWTFIVWILCLAWSFAPTDGVAVRQL